jgi:DNA-binding NtrC family response regulator
MINIHIQPLRERPEDIPLLIKHYFKIYCNQLDRSRKSFNEITDDVMELMLAYHWPGNVRELQNCIKRIVVLGCSEETVGFLKKTEKESQEIKPADETGDNQIELNIDPKKLITNNLRDGDVIPLKKIGRVAADEAEKEVILHVLKKTGWNRKKATKILKVSYPALLYKMKDLNIYPY